MVNRLRRALVLGAGGAIGGSLLASAALAAGPRPEATREVTLLSTYVAGAAYHGAAERAPRLRPGDGLELRRAPDNPYDARAIEVRTDDGAMLGYVPRIDNQALANLMDAGFRPTARVRAVVPDPARPEIRLDVSVAIPAAARARV